MRVAFGLMIVCAVVVRAGTNQWTNTGPEGGFVSSVAIDPQTPGTLYAATGAAVFKSSDRGASWGEAGPTHEGGVYRLVIDPTKPETLYALGGQLLRSTDAAVTWTALGFSCSCLDLAIDPLSSRLYLTSSEGVVYNSEDAGETWNAVKVAEGFLAASLAVDRRDSGVLYVAATLPVPGYRAVILKSTNGGLLWNESDSGLPLQPGILLTTDPSNSGVLYLSGGYHIFSSLDGGASWTPSDAGLPPSSSTLSPVAVDPQNANTLYVSTWSGLGTGIGIWKSADRNLEERG
jgi:photosystem II stability/assembly factor-like uncharacterized protein